MGAPRQLIKRRLHVEIAPVHQWVEHSPGIGAWTLGILFLLLRGKPDGSARVVYARPGGLQSGLVGSHLYFVPASLNPLCAARDQRTVHRRRGRNGICGAAWDHSYCDIRQTGVVGNTGPVGGGVPAAVHGGGRSVWRIHDQSLSEPKADGRVGFDLSRATLEVSARSPPKAR